MTAMVSTDRVLAFAAMSLLVIVIPGPSVLFVIGRALAHGRRTAVATALGNVFGSYLLVVAVAVGVGSLVGRSGNVYLAGETAGGPGRFPPPGSGISRPRGISGSAR